MAATSSPEARRLAMVNGQLRTGEVVDHEVLAAFLNVPREKFVAPGIAALAYVDRNAPALGAKTRRLLPPLTLARMLQAAAVKAGDRALDVGAGRGMARPFCISWARRSWRSSPTRARRRRPARRCPVARI